jgi:hypothetical protein
MMASDKKERILQVSKRLIFALVNRKEAIGCTLQYFKMGQRHILDLTGEDCW